MGDPDVADGRIPDVGAVGKRRPVGSGPQDEGAGGTPAVRVGVADQRAEVVEARRHQFALAVEAGYPALEFFPVWRLENQSPGVGGQAQLQAGGVAAEQRGGRGLGDRIAVVGVAPEVGVGRVEVRRLPMSLR